MLALALNEARQLGLPKVLMTSNCKFKISGS
jgi:predicted acetyltransferase